MPSYQDISDAILSGALDDKLDSIMEDMQTRQKVLARKRAVKAEQLPEGTKVRLVHVSPKKAEGATGVITYDTWNGQMGIRLDYSITSRLQAGKAYTYPASCYEQIVNPFDAIVESFNDTEDTE